MKVKHCFFFVLFLLAIGSFFAVRSYTHSAELSLKGTDNSVNYRPLKDTSHSIQRPSEAEPTWNFASPMKVSGAASSPSAAPSKHAVPAVDASLDAASSGVSNPRLSSQLVQCMSEMQVLQSALSARQDSTDDVRAQLQEALLKLRAAEEEVHRLQAQVPVTKNGVETNRCRIMERESSLCKSELRSSHAKVRSALRPRAPRSYSHLFCAVCCPAEHRVIVSGPRLHRQLPRRHSALKR